MGRPPDPGKRRELARRAVEVLEREGLGMSTASLAAALGVKRPTLLYHFADHGELVQAALEELLTEQAIHVLGRMAEHEHPVDRLFAQLRAVHEFHRGRERRIVFLTQAIAASAGARLDAILAAGNRVFEPHRRALVASLRRGIDEGTVAPCDPEALVALVRSAVDGLLLQRVMTGVALEPVHALLWERVLLPLKRVARPARPAAEGRAAKTTHGATRALAAARRARGAGKGRAGESRKASRT